VRDLSCRKTTRPSNKHSLQELNRKERWVSVASRNAVVLAGFINNRVPPRRIDHCNAAMHTTNRGINFFRNQRDRRFALSHIEESIEPLPLLKAEMAPLKMHSMQTPAQLAVFFASRSVAVIATGMSTKGSYMFSKPHHDSLPCDVVTYICEI